MTFTIDMTKNQIDGGGVFAYVKSVINLNPTYTESHVGSFDLANGLLQATAIEHCFQSMIWNAVAESTITHTAPIAKGSLTSLVWTPPVSVSHIIKLKI